MNSYIRFDNIKKYITLKNGWIIPSSKEDLINILNDFNEISVYKSEVEKLFMGVPLKKRNELKLLPGLIMSIKPKHEFMNKFQIEIIDYKEISRVFNELKVRKDIRKEALNPKFIKTYELKSYDGLDGEYTNRNIDISLNKVHQYVGFNINWKFE